MAAEHVFVPLHDQPGRDLGYGPWFLKFCTSVTWRILQARKLWGAVDDFPEPRAADADLALETWRQFLLDERPDVGGFGQQVVLLAPEAFMDHPDLPPIMARYVWRVIAADVGFNEAQAFVFAKMCRLVVVGFVTMPVPWTNTVVHADRGTIQPTRATVPRNFAEYMIDQARVTASAQGQLSPAQRKKLEEFAAANPERVANALGFQAAVEDARLFGKAAFRDNESSDVHIGDV
jgi:hypothetical protein